MEEIHINNKRTSSQVAAKAAKTLKSNGASTNTKKLAGSALAQRDPAKQTGAAMEKRASKTIRSNRSSATAKTLAGSVLSQSNKSR